MKFFGNGYTISKEIVSILLSEQSAISAAEIEKNGGGLVAVVLQVQDKRRLNLWRLVKDLLKSSGTGIHVVAVSLPASGGETVWRVVPLDQLRQLAQGAYDMKMQLRLEYALRARG